MKMIEREPETPKTTSPDPSPRRVNIGKKNKEPTPDLSTETEEEGSSKDVEEVEMVNCSEKSESKEVEAKPKTPLLEKTKLKNWTSE